MEHASFAPTPVTRPVDQIRLTILRAIATGRLRPGDRLPSEAEQARGFQVGRTAVREALRSLAALGVITTARGRGGGSFVNELDSAPIERNLGEAMELLLHFDAINLPEVLEARRALEGTCARMAATRRTAAQLTEMDEILDAASNPDLADEAWLALDIRFHRAMALSSGNRVLILPLAATHSVVQPRLNQAIVPLLRRSRINAQHRAIHEAIEREEPEAAEVAVNRHLDHLKRLYRRAGLL